MARKIEFMPPVQTMSGKYARQEDKVNGKGKNKGFKWLGAVTPKDRLVSTYQLRLKVSTQVYDEEKQKRFAFVSIWANYTMKSATLAPAAQSDYQAGKSVNGIKPADYSTFRGFIFAVRYTEDDVTTTTDTNYNKWPSA